MPNVPYNRPIQLSAAEPLTLTEHFMRRILILAACLFITGAAVSPTEVMAAQPSEAAGLIGQNATITGTVSEVHYDRKSGNTFINMGGRFPNHQFYGIVFSDSLGAFPDLQSLSGQTLSISGKVKSYKGKPQIVVSSPSQIVLH